jgi:carboxyl-terminal processing protease
VVAFAGRARSRRFGQGTRGVPTGSTTISLADGAMLVLTVTVYADRTGTRYDGVIPPDEAVAIDWTRFGATDDPVVVAARRWLESVADGK